MAPDTLLGRELAGYRLEALLGRGGMGVCYRAQDPELPRQVALKVIAPEFARDPAFRERFLQETKVAASLEHPHICPLYRAGEAEGGELYLAMRLLEPESLGARVAAEGPLPPERALSLLSQLASALDYAHARSLSHRDVKPENVLLDDSGNAYLTDFGLAQETFSAEEGEGMLAGTLAYLAPERWQGAPASPASDLYALACLACTLLTGEPHFQAEHEAGLLYAHLRQEPPSLAAHGLARLDPVLSQALAKDPASRQRSCAAFAQALAEAFARPEPHERWPQALPRPATRLVGRERELAELRALLHEPETRLLTLTGPGGTGKTRLALELAAESAARFPDGLAWVALAPLREPTYVLPAIAQALSLQEQPPTPLADTLAEALQGKELLLILDNAEHLLPSLADSVVFLRDLDAGPTLLCTSRERVDVQAERLYPVPALADEEGIELFRERASYANPAFDSADPALPALCARLDSLPLALELAAARSDLYSPSELLSRLQGHLDLLKGPRDADPRHQTLQATIAWSYELLGAEEQRVFRSLSVFAGGCTPDAAFEVAGADPALLASLVSKSLLRTRDAPSGRRYFLLETIRQYAAGKLEEAGEEEKARERHAEYCCQLAVESEPLLEGETSPADTIARLADEIDNMRSAFAYGIEHDPELVLRIASALRRFLIHHRADVAREARGLVSRVLNGTTPVRMDLRARALFTGGSLAVRWRFDLDEAGLQLDEAIELFRLLDDRTQLATALNNRGVLANSRDDLPKARSCYEEAITLYRVLDDKERYLSSLANLGSVSWQEGDFDSGRRALEEALVGLGRDSNILGQLALLEYCDENAGRARALALEALDAAETLTARAGTDAPWVLALCELRAGDTEAARSVLMEQIAYYATNTEDQTMGETLLIVASYGAHQDWDRESLELVGFAETLGVGATGYEQRWRKELLQTIGLRLDPSMCDARLERGRALSGFQAIEVARRILAAPVPESF